MDRTAWLRERRRNAEERFDTLYAPTYDEEDIEVTPTHRRFVAKVIERCPPSGVILDAACGTGKYFGMILDAGREVVGADQSAGMLDEARAKHPGARLEKVGLQELAFDDAFDGVICVDALENLPPEDWPRVLENLGRALRGMGNLYATVEQIDPAEVQQVYEEAVADGLPVVLGEHTARGGGYHYYPTEDQVFGWLAEAGLSVVERDTSAGDGYEYLHLLMVNGAAASG